MMAHSYDVRGGGVLPPEARWLISSLRVYWRRHASIIAIAVLANCVALVDPIVVGWVIDGFTRTRSIYVPVIGGALILTSYVVRLSLSSTSMVLGADTYQRLVCDLRLDLLKHFDRLPLEYHETTPVGAKSFLLINAVDDIAVIGAEIIPNLTRSVVTAVCASVALVLISGRIALILVPAIPLYVLASRYFRRKVRRSTDIANTAFDQMSQSTQEHLASVPQVQILSQETRELGRLSNIFSVVRVSQRQRIIDEVKHNCANGTITATCAAAVVTGGALLVQRGVMSIGDLVVCYSYLARVFEPLGTIAGANASLQKALSSVRRIREFMSIQPSVTTPGQPQPICVGGGLRVECDNVSFSYPQKGVALMDVTCTFEGGERVSIAGRSGAGKSTLAKIIARLYDPTCGIVRLNGTDARSLAVKDMRRAVHYMPQQAVLFTGTAEENLRYGNPQASEAELKAAIEMAQLSAVVQHMPRGLDQVLGPGGLQMSAGERQRFAIARALLCQPRVLILDEATALLDSAVEGVIFENLRFYLTNTTLIVISHRLPALTWVDRHIFLERGRIVDSGTHATLVKTSAGYRELYRFQDASSILALDSVSTVLPATGS